MANAPETPFTRGLDAPTLARGDSASSRAPLGKLLEIATPPWMGDVMLRHTELPPQLAEALRAIVNRYELREQAPLPSTIAVTAALSGEGVTTISQALATIIAHEMDSLVCWVDCSWLSTAPPPPYTVNRPSLVDILEEPSSIMSALQSSPECPRLMCLTVGPIAAARRNTIVRSAEFQQLLSGLGQEFDHVILDVPPVVAHSSGLALLQRSDASLLVVRHRSTTTSQFRAVVEATQPTPNLGVVLNRFRTRIPGFIRHMLGD